MKSGNPKKSAGTNENSFFSFWRKTETKKEDWHDVTN